MASSGAASPVAALGRSFSGRAPRASLPPVSLSPSQDVALMAAVSAASEEIRPVNRESERGPD